MNKPLLIIIDYSVLKNVFEDHVDNYPDANAFLLAMKEIKARGGHVVTTPSQFFNALMKADYLKFHAGNMQRTLEFLEFNFVVPKEFEGKIIEIKYQDMEALRSEVIILAKGAGA